MRGGKALVRGVITVTIPREIRDLEYDLFFLEREGFIKGSTTSLEGANKDMDVLIIPERRKPNSKFHKINIHLVGNENAIQIVERLREFLKERNIVGVVSYTPPLPQLDIE